MMGGLSSSLGLGVVLKWKDQMTGGVKQAERTLQGLKRTSDNVADKIVKDTDRIRRQMDKARQGMKWSMGAMGVGAGVLGGMTLLAKESAKAEDRLQNIASLRVGPGIGAEQIAKEMGKVKNVLADVAENTRIPAAQIDAAFYDMVSALGDVDLAAVGADAAAKTAVAGMGTMAEATGLVSSALAVYGGQWEETMSHQEMTSMLFNQTSAAVQKFKTTLPSLAAGMAEVMGVAKNLGLSFSEIETGLGFADTLGLGGSRSGTAYKAFLRQLVAKRDELEKAGIRVFDDEGKFLGVGEVLKNIEVGLDVKPGETLTGDQAGFINKIFGEEGGMFTANMLGRADEFLTKSKEIENSTAGAAMVAERMKGALAAWERMTNTVGKLADELGSNLLSPLKAVIDAVWKATKWLRQFALAHPDAAKWAAWGTAAFGALLLVGGAIGTVLFGLKMLHANMAMVALAKGTGVTLRSMGALGKTLFWLGNTTPILKLRLAFSALGSTIVSAISKAALALKGLSLAFLTNPIGIAIMAVIALAAAVYLLIKYWDEVVAWVQKAAKWMFDTFRNGPIWARILISPLMLIVGAVVLIIKAFQGLWKFGKWAVGKLYGIFKKIPGWVFMLFGPIGMLIGGIKLIIDHWDWVKEKVAWVWGKTKELASDFWGWIKGVWGDIKGTAESAWGSIKDAAEWALNAIIDSPGFKVIKWFFDKVVEGAEWLLRVTGLDDVAKDIKEAAIEMGKAVGEGVVDGAKGAGGLAQSAAGAVVDAFNSGMNSIYEWGATGEIKRAFKLGKFEGINPQFFDAFGKVALGFKPADQVTAGLLSGQIAVTVEGRWAQTLGEHEKRYMALPQQMRESLRHASAAFFDMSLDPEFKFKWVKQSTNAARKAAGDQQSALEKAASDMGFEIPTTMGEPASAGPGKQGMEVNAFIGKTVAAGANQINVTALIEKIRPPMVEVPIVGIMGQVRKPGLDLEKALNLPAQRLSVVPAVQKANVDARKLVSSPQLVQMIGVLSRIDTTLPQLEMLIRPLLADLPTPPTLNIPTSVVNPDVRLSTLPAPHVPAEAAVSPSDRPMPREWPPAPGGQQGEATAPMESESQQESVRLLGKIARLMEIKEDKIEIKVPPGDNGGNARELARQIARELDRKRLRGKDGRF